MRDRKYEELYNRLLERGIDMHLSNKRRIRIGLILLVLLPLILILIRWLTESDRVVFLLIYVFCMFALCTYLISVEYIDSTLKKTLDDVTERESGFDELLLDSEKVREKVQGRIQERHEDIHERIQERHDNIHERMKERRENIHERMEGFLRDSYYERSYEAAEERRSADAGAARPAADAGSSAGGEASSGAGAKTESGAGDGARSGAARPSESEGDAK